MQKNTVTYLLASLLVIPGVLVGGIASASIVSGNLTTLPNSIVAPPVTPVVPPVTPTTPTTPGGGTPTNNSGSSTPSTGGGGASVVTNSTAVGAATTWILGDINKSGRVDEYDLAIMMSQWGGVGTQSADLNKDNKVDVYDFSLLMANWSI